MDDAGTIPMRTVAPAPGDEPAARKAEEQRRLKKACADFESIFLYYMLKKMRATVPKSGLVNEARSRDTYETIVDQKVSETLADQGGVGLQKMLYDQIGKRDLKPTPNEN